MHDRGFQLAREFDQLRVRSGTTRSSLQEAQRGGRRERQIHFLRAVSSPPTITTRATCSGIDFCKEPTAASDATLSTRISVFASTPGWQLPSAFQSCHDSARQRQRKFALDPSHDGRRGDRGMIPPPQYIHHATVSVKGIPLAIRPCLHEYGRDPASGVDLRCARGDVGCQLRRISASRRLAVLVRGVVSEEFVAMRSTRQKAVLMVSIVHGGFHHWAGQVPCHGGRHVERRSLAVALRRTPQCRRRHVGTCRDVGACREGPITWQTMAKGLEIKRSRTTPCRPSEHTPGLQRLIPRETEVLLVDRPTNLAAEAFPTPSSRKLRPRSPSRAPGERATVTNRPSASPRIPTTVLSEVWGGARGENVRP
jgi:hypothetical protein